MIKPIFVCNFVCVKQRYIQPIQKISLMDKYKHRVSFRLEKRKDKNGNLPEELPINADITFGGKRIWYYSDTVLPSQSGMKRYRE